MVLISKTECESIRQKYPDASIIRTAIQRSSRHRYYLPERPEYLRHLQRLRKAFTARPTDYQPYKPKRAHSASERV